jgi:1-acyl-sn-glycerol-3-phosphate acyltransferase
MDLRARVPAAATVAKVAHRGGVGVARRYHRLEVTLPGEPIDEPVLFVANHGFGGVFDLNVSAAYAAFEDLALTRPVIALTHQLAWTLGAGELLESVGSRPASRASALGAFEAGENVLVLPGGDVEAAKSFADRNKIVFSGRRGFAQLAMDADVPIVPVVTAGAGESLLVLSDGQRLARALRLDSLLRAKTMPVAISVPWGLTVGIGALLPYLGLPAKLRTTVLAPMRPAAGESAGEFGDRVEDAMQATLTAMTAGRRPIIG